MNWKVLLLGSVIITVVFISFIGFQFIDSRKNNLSLPQETPVTNYVFYENGEIPDEGLKNIAKDVRSQTVLIRGNVVSYNQQSDIVSLAVESIQKNGLLSAVGILEVKIEEKLTSQFLCWPEHVKTSNGIDIDVKKSIFPINDDSFLFMKGETKNQINTISNFLENKPFAFILLTSSPTDAQSLITDTTNLPVQTAKEIAILGCTN